MQIDFVETWLSSLSIICMDFIIFNFGDVYPDESSFSLSGLLLNLIPEIVGAFLFLLVYNNFLVPLFSFVRIKKFNATYIHCNKDIHGNYVPCIFPMGEDRKQCYSVISASFWRPYCLRIISYDYSKGVERIWREHMILNSSNLLTGQGNFIYDDTSEVGYHEYFVVDKLTILVKIIMPDNKSYLYYFRKQEKN